MKALIIEEKDVQALMAKLELELERFQLEKDAMRPIDALHRRFHYVIVNWLHEQGSSYPHI